MNFSFQIASETGKVVRGNCSRVRNKPPSEPSEVNIQKLKYIRWCALQRQRMGSDIGGSAKIHLCRQLHERGK